MVLSSGFFCGHNLSGVSATGRKLSAEDLVLLKCGAEEDSYESLGQ